MSEHEKSHQVLLEHLADTLAEVHVRAQLEVALPTLEFLEAIVDKSKEDEDKVSRQKALVKTLSGAAYRRSVEKIFTEAYSHLETGYVQRYLEDIRYERALVDAGVTLSAMLQDNQGKFIQKVLSKVQ